MFNFQREFRLILWVGVTSLIGSLPYTLINALYYKEPDDRPLIWDQIWEVYAMAIFLVAPIISLWWAPYGLHLFFARLHFCTVHTLPFECTALWKALFQRVHCTLTIV